MPRLPQLEKAARHDLPEHLGGLLPPGPYSSVWYPYAVTETPAMSSPVPHSRFRDTLWGRAPSPQREKGLRGLAEGNNGHQPHTAMLQGASAFPTAQLRTPACHEIGPSQGDVKAGGGVFVETPDPSMIMAQANR